MECVQARPCFRGRKGKQGEEDAMREIGNNCVNAKI